MVKTCAVLDLLLDLFTGIFKLVAGAVWTLPATSLSVPIAVLEDLVAPTAMALENLRYGSFKPTTVTPEARALPGYGGQVEERNNYHFQVKALEMKEGMLSDTEKKKLGPLALRLIERLQGPALQIAKGIGLERLANPTGTQTLLEALEADLLPLRRQTAVEMYQAGSQPGMMSRQTGEAMSSYVLRRETWWTQLQELDSEVKCSPAILGEQMLTQAGLTNMEVQLIRATLKNDLKDLKQLAKVLRDQFGQVHERERSRKGKGDSRYRGWNNWGKGQSYMAENVEENGDSGGAAEDYVTAETYDMEEHYDDEIEGAEAEMEETFEEDIVAWFADQGIHTQTCGMEDLEVIYDTVETEAAAYFARQQAAQRGYSIPAQNNYQSSSNSTPQERQARVLAAKQRTRCRACGQQGHWQRDWICPKRRSKGKGKGGKDKGKAAQKGKYNSGGDSPTKSPGGSTKSPGGSSNGGKPRVVYFSVKNDRETGEKFAGMALRREPEVQEPLEDAQQRHREQEVLRLMQLPSQDLERQFQHELGYMVPTSKAGMMTPPSHLRHEPGQSSQGVLETPASMASARSLHDADLQVPGDDVRECLHEETTRRGTNAYVDMISCRQCGKVLSKVRKDSTREDRPMHTRSQDTCPHMEVSWKGTNGYTWKWTCESCGLSDQVRKVPGVPRPIPGKVTSIASPPRRTTTGGASVQESPSVRVPDLVLFRDEESWSQCLDLLDRMVRSHLAIHGSITNSEMSQLLNAVTLCVRNLDPRVADRVIPMTPGQTGMPPLPRRVQEPEDEDGQRIITFGKHKDKTFSQVYLEDPGYVDWTLREMDKSEGFCPGMKKWMNYCSRRRGLGSRRSSRESTPATAFMVTDEESAIMWVNEDDEAEECKYLFLDSGCNQTCHGEKWMEKFIQHTGYEPGWIHQEGKSLNGIGGKTETLGERELYITFENMDGQHVPGEISSTEIKGSYAPLLLSLPSQERLGLVIDFSASEIYSKVLGMTFKAVRGRRNRLLGLKMEPCTGIFEDSMVEDPDLLPMALMANEGGSQEGPPWKKGRTRVPGNPRPKAAASSSSTTRGPVTEITPGHTEEVKPVPTLRDHQAEQEEEVDDEVLLQVEESPEEEIDQEDANQQGAEDVGWAEDREEEAREEENEEEYDEPYEEPEQSPEEPDGEEEPFEVEDYWTQHHTTVIRHHVHPRKKLYRPAMDRMDLPVDIGRLELFRVTMKLYEDGATEEVRDTWTDDTQEADILTKTHRGVTTFQRGPLGVHLMRRVTYNLQSGEVLGDDGELELLDAEKLDRPLPGGAQDIKVEHHFVDERAEEKPWTGSTLFRLKEIEDCEKEKAYDIDPREDKRRFMTKGQKKALEKEIESVAEVDCAMWSVLTRQPAHLPRGWKFVFELFCGCALLTRMCQAAGYPTCDPLDVNNGWNVFNSQHRRHVHETLEKENPYLLCIAFPCGPWSPWQNMAEDQEEVFRKRQVWLPVLRWIKNLVKKHKQRGGVCLLENPKPSAAWKTQELRELQVENPRPEDYELIGVDMCAFGLRDCDSHLLHRKATYLGTDSPGVKEMMRGKTCSGGHEHQSLEGSNSRGSRTRQAAKWTSRFCKAVIQGVQKDLQEMIGTTFASEAAAEDQEEEPHPLDEVYDEQDLGSARPSPPQAELDLVREENLEGIQRVEEPQSEQLRREAWLRISKQERIGIRRLHVMTSHATKPQMQRMLRYSNAPAAVIAAVKHFRCGACERISEEKRPAVVKPPNPYVFGDEVGLDVFEVKDAEGVRYHVLHAVCSGTTFQVGEVLGLASGVPSSKTCLEAFSRFWLSWAGTPTTLLVDRGTHNRGIFQMELEKLGINVKSIATEAPHQIARTERHGGLLKSMVRRIINAVQAVGSLEVQLALTQALETKNRLGNVGGFSPAQWVLGRNPKLGGWTDEDEEAVVIHDEDPSSTFNRRGAMREAARSAWATEDSLKRVRKAMLRKGGSETQRFQQGDLVAFMRKKQGALRWYGPARVLTMEGKNVWILHGGVPILTAENMVRPASSEEYLEKEILPGGLKDQK